MSTRSGSAKNGVNTQASRARRESVTLSIRKEKREGGLAKRRMMSSTSSAPSIPSEAWGEESSESKSAEGSSKSVPGAAKKPQYSVHDFPTMVQGLKNSDVNVQLENLRGFRRILSAEKNPPVQQCMDCGAIPLMVDALQSIDNQDLQFEAAWALTNIASTDYTQVVVEYGAIPHLVQLLDSVNPDVREQAAWCLGNVAGDGPNSRDLILQYNSMELLLKNISQPATLSLLRNATWTLSNFCRNKPQPDLEKVRPALPALAMLISSQVDDEDTRIDAAWALSYICDGDNDRIEAVIEQGVAPSLISMCRSGVSTQIMPALRTLGNIVSGSDTQTQAVLDAGLLTLAPELLQKSKKSIRKEACWAISNVAAGTPLQLDYLMQHGEVMSLVLDLMGSSSEWDVRKEAVWVVSNIATAAKDSHLLALLKMNALKPLVQTLEVQDDKVTMCAIEALEVFLKFDSKRSDLDLLNIIADCGGIDALETLQEHSNEDIYSKAVELIEAYFGGEEEDMLENVAPEMHNNQFSFGIPVDTTSARATSAFSGQSPKHLSFGYGAASSGGNTVEAGSSFDFGM